MISNRCSYDIIQNDGIQNKFTKTITKFRIFIQNIQIKISIWIVSIHLTSTDIHSIERKRKQKPRRLEKNLHFEFDLSMNTMVTKNLFSLQKKRFLYKLFPRILSEYTLKISPEQAKDHALQITPPLPHNHSEATMESDLIIVSFALISSKVAVLSVEISI